MDEPGGAGRVDGNGHCPACGRLLILAPKGTWWCVTCDEEPPWNGK